MMTKTSSNWAACNFFVWKCDLSWSHQFLDQNCKVAQFEGYCCRYYVIKGYEVDNFWFLLTQCSNWTTFCCVAMFAILKYRKNTDVTSLLCKVKFYYCGMTFSTEGCWDLEKAWIMTNWQSLDNALLKKFKKLLSEVFCG